MKKAQVLGGKLRLMAFEWTHLACPRSVYERMVESMALKVKHPQPERELRALVYQRYGMSGRVGWLYPGLSQVEMEGVMGSKAIEMDGGLKWEGRLGDYNAVMEVEEGKMVRLMSEGPRTVSEVPVEGSLSWIELAISGKPSRNGGDLFGEEKEAKPLVVAANGEIMSALTKCAGSATGYEWREVCRFGAEMATERGVKSDDFLKLILKQGEVSSDVLAVLEAYDYDDLSNWIEEGLESLLLQSPRELEPDSSWDEPMRRMKFTLHTLLENRLVADQNEGEAWILRFLHETERRWRWALLGLRSQLPPELNQQIVESNLEDVLAENEWWIVNDVFSMLGCSRYNWEDFSESEGDFGLENKEAVVSLVKKLPEGEPEGLWFNRRKAVIEALSKE